MTLLDFSQFAIGVIFTIVIALLSIDGPRRRRDAEKIVAMEGMGATQW